MSRVSTGGSGGAEGSVSRRLVVVRFRVGGIGVK